MESNLWRLTKSKEIIVFSCVINVKKKWAGLICSLILKETIDYFYLLSLFLVSTFASTVSQRVFKFLMLTIKSMITTCKLSKRILKSNSISWLSSLHLKELI
jgi:hypothetical protein